MVVSMIQVRSVIALSICRTRLSRFVAPTVYHYHSNFDSFAWMEKFGDPTFERHVVVSKILGLTALRLIEDIVLPLNTTGEFSESISASSLELTLSFHPRSLRTRARTIPLESFFPPQLSRSRTT